MSIIDDIAAAKYLATPDQVQQLARHHLEASSARANGGRTYLGILIATLQYRVGRKADAVAALDALHKQIYQDVIAGVIEPNLPKSETQRRAAFARSAASTLRAYLAAGGALVELSAASTSKQQLRQAIAPPEPEDRRARTLMRAERSIVRVIHRIAKTDRAQALKDVMALIDRLHTERETLEHEQDVSVVSHTLTRSAPTGAHVYQ